MQVNRFKAQYIAMYGEESAVDGGSSTGNGSEADFAGGDAHGSCSGGSLHEVKAAKMQVSPNCCFVKCGIISVVVTMQVVVCYPYIRDQTTQPI